MKVEWKKFSELPGLNRDVYLYDKECDRMVIFSKEEIIDNDIRFETLKDDWDYWAYVEYPKPPIEEKDPANYFCERCLQGMEISTCITSKEKPVPDTSNEIEGPIFKLLDDIKKMSIDLNKNIEIYKALQSSQNLQNELFLEKDQKLEKRINHTNYTVRELISKIETLVKRINKLDDFIHSVRKEANSRNNVSLDNYYDLNERIERLEELHLPKE